MTTSSLCIIFSRFPHPGRSKTRLIAELGPDGAAHLQKQMTEHLLTAANLLDKQHASLQVELHMADATPHGMQNWLTDTMWRSQQGADLGARMAHSFSTSFRKGFGPIILAGADCPSLDSTILSQAFHALENHDVVLGPSQDGGYYLIGLRQDEPSLFTTMPWGQVGILAETTKRISKAGLSHALLPVLRDIDNPADLAYLPKELNQQLPHHYQEKSSGV